MWKNTMEACSKVPGEDVTKLVICQKCLSELKLNGTSEILTPHFKQYVRHSL